MRKIEHLGIAVKDLEASNALFEKLLGAPAYKMEEVASEGVRTSFFKSGPNKIELLEYHRAFGLPLPLSRSLEAGDRGDVAAGRREMFDVDALAADTAGGQEIAHCIFIRPGSADIKAGIGILLQQFVDIILAQQALLLGCPQIDMEFLRVAG